MLLSRRIKAIRLHKGFSQIEMANKLEIDQSTYCGYEREAGNLKFNTVVKIADALECSIPFLTDIHSDIIDELKWKASLNKVYI
jgi:transcriptional regulator with XRE-family HTH domain